MTQDYAQHRLAAACRRVGVSIDDAKSRNRTQSWARMRSRVWWLMRQPDSAGQFCSYSDIGRVCGWDHTSVIHLVRTHRPFPEDLVPEIMGDGVQDLTGLCTMLDGHEPKPIPPKPRIRTAAPFQYDHEEYLRIRRQKELEGIERGGMIDIRD